jgi:hypothetical protein
MSAKVGSIIPVQQRYQECLDNSSIFDKPKCLARLDIESILNKGIEKCGHHMLYKSIPTGYALPTDVRTKRILHKTGVEGLAVVGDIDAELMYLWVENGILLKNTEAKLGLINSANTSMYLAPDPEKTLAEFKAWLKGQPIGKQEKIRAGAIGQIGIDPATAAFVITLTKVILAAFVAAVPLLIAMREKKAYAMAEARGFGTNAFSANQGDWMGTPSTGNDNLLLLGGAAAALYFLSDN